MSRALSPNPLDAEEAIFELDARASGGYFKYEWTDIMDYLRGTEQHPTLAGKIWRGIQGHAPYERVQIFLSEEEIRLANRIAANMGFPM